MDGDRFDALARTLGSGRSRRGALKTLLGGALGGAAVVLGGGATDAASKPKPPKIDCCPADHPTLCGFTCTATATDINNCGACGSPCVLANVTANCSGGQCGIASCNAGFDNCDGNALNGCETNLNTDNNNCGACRHACLSTQTCSGGQCVTASTCSDGVKNGQETDIDCGGGTCPKCAAGKTCQAASDCASGLCCGNVCVVNSDANCGACGNACAGDGTICGRGTCDATTHVCDYPSTTTTCVTPSCANGMETLAANCDGAGHCQTPVTQSCAPYACNGSACATTCSSDGDCAATAYCSSGACVQDLPNGVACARDAQCASGQCASGICCDRACTGECVTCASGACLNQSQGTVVSAQTLGDCQQNVCDGAGNVVSVADNSDVPNDGNQCTNDICVNGAPSNVNLSSGASCNQNGGMFCDGNGACVACLSMSDCPAAADHCHVAACNGGVCGTAVVADGTFCPINNGTGTCTDGQCSNPVYCSSGFGNCDNNPANGCEVNFTNDPQNCGSCGNACTAVHGSASCVGGQCAIVSCASPYSNCDGLYSTGCEANTLTDPKNCGGCGNVCATGKSCSNGVCA